MKFYNSWWSAAWRRALRTVLQTLGSTLPAGYIVTTELLRDNGIELIYAAAAWLLTGLLAGLASLFTSLLTTLPEVEYAEKGAHENADGK